MGIEANYILGAIAIGLGATLVMDLWNQFLNSTFSIPSLNYCLLGRWLRHMPAGTFRHANITATPQKAFECTVGWIAHYTIGVVFALVYSESGCICGTRREPCAPVSCLTMACSRFRKAVLAARIFTQRKSSV